MSFEVVFRALAVFVIFMVTITWVTAYMASIFGSAPPPDASFNYVMGGIAGAPAGAMAMPALIRFLRRLLRESEKEE